MVLKVKRENVETLVTEVVIKKFDKICNNTNQKINMWWWNNIDAIKSLTKTTT